MRLLEFAAARGHDPEAACRSAGLSFAAMRDPAFRVAYGSAERLSMHILELSRDPNFGLHLAQSVQDPRTFDAGLLMMMASPSLRVALERMERYQRYWGDGSRARLLVRASGVCIRYALPGASGEYQRHADECALAEVVLGARALTGRALQPNAVRFRHAAPPNIREHAALFGTQLEFAAAHTELELDNADVDAPMPHANETYRAIFQEQVERALSRLPNQSGLAQNVRDAVQAALAAGDCTLASTARTLGVSTRTLQRRLQAEGTSFAEVIDALRSELAREYLSRELPVQEIAWLLGYAEPSAFHHAFKRWTGMTPEQARGTRNARGTNARSEAE